MNSHTKSIKSRVGLLHLAEQSGNVTRACKLTGAARDSFYPVEERHRTGGEEALREVGRRKPIADNRAASEAEEAVSSRWPLIIQPMVRYNCERPHGGRCCYGKTPMQTFAESLAPAEGKLLNHVSPPAGLVDPDPFDYQKGTPQLPHQLLTITT